MTDPFLLHLGLARKAGYVIAGQDRLFDNIKRVNCHLIIMTTDAGQAARRKTGSLAERLGIPVMTGYEREALGGALGLKRCTVAGVTDAGFAAGLIKKAPTGSIVTGVSEE